MPFEEIRSTTRFFLPQARAYYTPNSFFTQFCGKYRVDFFAHKVENNETLWFVRTALPEAPVLFFYHGGKIHSLSDNGDWYALSIKE